MSSLEQYEKGDHKLIQALNRSKVLNKIRTEGPISRIDLAKNKLSPSTVASAVQELIKEGYVSEIGTGSSSGGRKPILLKFNPDNHYLFAVAITNSVMMLARMNLEAKVLRKETHSSRAPRRSHYRAALSLMDDFMSGQVDLERCVGISINVPGIVSDSQGMVRYNTKLRMTDVPLKRIMEERYGADVGRE